MAEGESYFSIGSFAAGPNNELLAYSVDTVSRRLYTVYVKNIATGELYADTLTDTTGQVYWANDNQTLFYTRQHPTTLRSYQVYRHTYGQDVSTDELVYEEKDDEFSCGVGKSRSKRYILIGVILFVDTQL